MKIISIFLIAIAILFVACKEDNGVKYIDEWIEIVDTTQISIDCIDLESVEDKYIINDSLNYNSLYNILFPYFNCSDYILPHIDFSEKTLLGFETRTGFVEFERKVFRNDYRKEYLYSIGMKTLENGAILHINCNWIVVPKIDDAYSVVFDTTHIQ